MTNPHKATRSGVYYWRSYGDCAVDRRRFDSTRGSDIAAAKRICRKCVVREECTKAALTDPTLEGMWAALTAEERAQYRKVMGK